MRLRATGVVVCLAAVRAVVTSCLQLGDTDAGFHICLRESLLHVRSFSRQNSLEISFLNNGRPQAHHLALVSASDVLR